MSYTIRELWNGNIAPCDSCGENDPEIKELISLMDRNKHALLRIITPQQQDLLEKYSDCSEEYVLRLTEQAFVSGFSLAYKLTMEANSLHCYEKQP